MSKNKIIKKIYLLKIILKKFISIFFIFFIINPAYSNNVKNSAVVFMYHKFDISKYPSTNITIQQFKDHITEFKKDKYQVKSLDYIIDAIINDGEFEKKIIGISVDDAHKSFLEVAWPIFKENNFSVTLFVSTATINQNNKNYLNWNDIRALKKDGVTIGSHSHKHGHLSNYNIKELQKEIETSNKIFLNELGEIPHLFAYPYGEADEKLFELLKNYKFKVAFGQHSGVINETSNLYYLPRFSLNERYGNIDRVKFTANLKGIGIYDFVPSNPNISENPPFIGFSLLDQSLAKNIECFIFDKKGKVDSEMFKFNERIEIRLLRKIQKGRSRLNCTVKSNNIWRWFGRQFFLN